MTPVLRPASVLWIGAALAGLCSVSFTACSGSSDTGSPAGAAGADGGSVGGGAGVGGSSSAVGGSGGAPSLGPPNPNHPCALAVTISGGLSVSFTGASDMGCGSNSTSVHWDSGRLGDPSTVTLYITFASPLAGGETGPLVLSKVRVLSDPDTAGTGDESTWEFDAASCTVQFDSSVSSPTSLLPNRWLISGHGSCTGQGIDPTGAAAPISLSPFAFNGYIDPD